MIISYIRKPLRKAKKPHWIYSSGLFYVRHDAAYYYIFFLSCTTDEKHCEFFFFKKKETSSNLKHHKVPCVPPRESRDMNKELS